MDGLSLGLGVVALIAFVVLFALLHPDPARRREARDILDRLLSVLPWGRRPPNAQPAPELPPCPSVDVQPAP
jgi:hypothetical protein